MAKCVLQLYIFHTTGKVFYMNNDLAETTQTLRPANRIYFVLCWFFGGWLGLHFLYLKKYIWCAVTILWLISVFVTRIPQLGHLYWWFVVLSGLLFYRTKQEKMRHIVWSFILQAVLVILFIFSIPVMLSIRQEKKYTDFQCISRMKQLGVCIEHYRLDNGMLPDKLDSLPEDMLSNVDIECSVSGEKFIYLVPETASALPCPTAYDSLNSPHQNGSVVLWSDGTVSWCRSSRSDGKFATAEELFEYARKTRVNAPPAEQKGSQ